MSTNHFSIGVNHSFVFAFAPMEPYTANPILRELMIHSGASIVVRPKIMIHHLLKAKKWQKYEKMLIWDNRRKKNKIFYDGVQLLLNLKDRIPSAIRFLSENAPEIGIDFIDLNFGCPANSVISKGRGGGLLKNPHLIIQIIDKVLKYSDLPVSVKIRRGFSCEDSVSDLLKRIRKEFGGNIAWIVINRAPVKMYNCSVRSIIKDLSIFENAVEILDKKIPLLVNGATYNPNDLLYLKDKGVWGSMIGRFVLGYPSYYSYLQSLFFSPSNSKQNNTSIQSKSRKTAIPSYINYEEEFSKLFSIIHKYVGKNTGRWTTIGPLKDLLYFYIKKRYVEGFYPKKGFLHKSAPKQAAPIGAVSWKKRKFSRESLIKTLSLLFPEIRSEKWSQWLYYLPD